MTTNPKLEDQMSRYIEEARSGNRLVAGLVALIGVLVIVAIAAPAINLLFR